MDAATMTLNGARWSLLNWLYDQPGHLSKRESADIAKILDLGQGVVEEAISDELVERRIDGLRLTRRGCIKVEEDPVNAMLRLLAPNHRPTLARTVQVAEDPHHVLSALYLGYATLHQAESGRDVTNLRNFIPLAKSPLACNFVLRGTSRAFRTLGYR